MAKLPLYAACITATFTTLLTGAAAEDVALLKQAQGIFQPLPKDNGTTAPSRTSLHLCVRLGNPLFGLQRSIRKARRSNMYLPRPAFGRAMSGPP